MDGLKPKLYPSPASGVRAGLIFDMGEIYYPDFLRFRQLT